MRLFIAIEIPDEIKREMAKVQDQLRSVGKGATWSRPEGIHLTLKFLGETPESSIPQLMSVLESATQGTGAFRLEIRGAGAFPNAKHPRVIWLGIAGDRERLVALQASVEETITMSGYDREERKFNPHLTLGRIKYLRPRDNWQAALEGIADIRLPGFGVSSVSLMRSELLPSGAVYTEIGRVELK